MSKETQTQPLSNPKTRGPCGVNSLSRMQVSIGRHASPDKENSNWTKTWPVAYRTVPCMPLTASIEWYRPICSSILGNSTYMCWAKRADPFCSSALTVIHNILLECQRYYNNVRQRYFSVTAERVIDTVQASDILSYQRYFFVPLNIIFSFVL